MNRTKTPKPPASLGPLRPNGGSTETPGLSLGTAESELERLKYSLLRHELAQAAPVLVVSLRRAANEAAALAWLESHPLLVFPTLFNELVLAARRRAYKQEFVRARSAEFFREAA